MNDGKSGQNRANRVDGSNSLAGLLQNATQRGYRYQGAKLRLDSINVLPQPRKTFENLEELAQDIAKKQMLNPPTVAKFDRPACADYLMVVNLLWGTTFGFEDLKAEEEGGAEVFYVLLAGERRIRSCRLLWNRGCLECLEQHGAEPVGTCFRRHFSGDEVEVRLGLDMSAFAALFLQLSENTHMAVPSHEEAEAYALLYGLIRQADGKFTVTRFAREVGRSPETIRRALRYSELPTFIKEAVERGQVAYGAAAEIARLQENGVSDDSLRWWLKRAMVENLKVDDFREIVSRHLLDLSSGQTSLLGIVLEERRRQEEQAHIRRVVSANTVNCVWTWIHYLGRVQSLVETGQLGRRDSPFSESSPLRVFRTLIERLRLLLPHLRELIGEQEYASAEATLNEAETLANSVPIRPDGK